MWGLALVAKPLAKQGRHFSFISPCDDPMSLLALMLSTNARRQGVFIVDMLCFYLGIYTWYLMEPIPVRTNIEQVTKAVLILVEKEYKNHAWDRAKKMMNNVDQFKNRQAGNSHCVATVAPASL